MEPETNVKQDVLVTAETIHNYCVALEEGLQERLKIKHRMLKLRDEEKKNNEKVNDARRNIGGFNLGFVTV